MTRAAEAWGDRPLFIVGGGPSLRGRDLSSLRSRGRVLGVNRAAEFWPVDATFSQDIVFMDKHRSLLEAGIARGEEVYLAVAEGYAGRLIEGAVYFTRSEAGQGKPGDLVNGKHSGHGALQLALRRGARDITLLGYDLHPVTSEEPAHWYDGPRDETTMIYFARWANAVDALAAELPPGVVVRNANPNSAVTAFPLISYEEVGL